MEQTNYFDKREIGEIYNGLVSLYMFCRGKRGMKRRAKYIQKLMRKVYGGK